MAIRIKRAESSEELAGGFQLRHEVFVEEQSVPLDIERDSLDDSALHGVALEQRGVVGTGRLVMEGDGNGRIGRMAVDRGLRGQRIGAQLLAFLEAEARLRGARFISLHAQTYVKGFYSSHGYQEEGNTFIEAGIEHVLMSKDLGAEPGSRTGDTTSA